VTGKVSSLAPGDHGFHIHQFGDYASGKREGGEGKRERGRVEAILVFLITSCKCHRLHVCCIEAQYMITTCTVHADPDDLGKDGHPDSLTTGHAGARLACGVIGSTKLQ
ncbi:PREDICTED: superoxide dismutase [Cu-Zn]-like, partial [Amphimedon queenslandica]|uniref:Superoxide dismutase [Cu-Zn] n=1 Tax=Amphimedon queenslandica TaxID=400682 RepID=A0AAN0JSL3_AMPQE